MTPVATGETTEVCRHDSRAAVDDQDLHLPDNLAPGNYRLAVEVYDTQRPDVPLSSSKLSLGWIEVR